MVFAAHYSTKRHDNDKPIALKQSQNDEISRKPNAGVPVEHVDVNDRIRFEKDRTGKYGQNAIAAAVADADRVLRDATVY